jgi:uncharacterized membrane protein
MFLPNSNVNREARACESRARHMLVNSASVVLFIIDLLVRLNSNSRTILPLVLSFAALSLLGIGGWLGGEMVCVRGLGVQKVEPSTEKSFAGIRE